MEDLLSAGLEFIAAVLRIFSRFDIFIVNAEVIHALCACSVVFKNKISVVCITLITWCSCTDASNYFPYLLYINELAFMT